MVPIQRSYDLRVLSLSVRAGHLGWWLPTQAADKELSDVDWFCVLYNGTKKFLTLEFSSVLIVFGRAVQPEICGMEKR